MKKFRIKIDLPGCPKGRFFKSSFYSDNYFHLMTDEEYISGEFQCYEISSEFIEDNEKMFELVESNDENF